MAEGQMKVSKLLKDYMGWVNADAIEFLKEKERKVEVNECIEALKTTMEKIENGNDKEGQLWYAAHKDGRKLWEMLAKYALRNIEPTAKGNSTLYDFLNAATEFEDILYGSEPYYRDHILHSLWVYLIGEYILREKLKDTGIREGLEWYLFNDIKEDAAKYKYADVLVNYSEIKANIITNVVTRYADAIWCIVALCHDLGYSLERLGTLNDKVRKVLEFFNISNLERTGYSLDIEHQYLISQFLELMAMDIRIVPGENYYEIKDEDYKNIKENLKKITGTEREEKINKELKKQFTKKSIKLDTAKIIKTVAGFRNEKKLHQINKLEEETLVKCYRDDSTYWRLCRALEKKQHGILSAYLIFKILGIFADATVRGPAEEWGLDDDEVVENIIRGHILFAIAQHEFDFAHIFEFNSLADVLLLADELEEFSRLGRPLQSREYLPTTATAEVDFNLNEGNIEINIAYDVKENHNLISFFIRKAERLCSVYSLNERDEPKGRYSIQQITMTAKKKSKLNNGGSDETLKLTIEINKGPNSVARLPKYKSSGTVSNSDTKDYPISLYDDKISITVKERGKPPGTKLLNEWFKMIEGRATSPEWEDEIDEYMELQKQPEEKT